MIKTITEDYVDFETAKLLKEKGFIAECSRWYLIRFPEKGLMTKGFATDDEYIPAPTLQTAMKWLREVYHITINAVPYAPLDRHPTHHLGEADLVYIAHIFVNADVQHRKGSANITRLTYEEAIEASLKYTLENLIPEQVFKIENLN